MTDAGTSEAPARTDESTAPQSGAAAEVASEAGTVATEGVDDFINESQLTSVQVSWTGFAVTIGGLIAVLFARRLLQADQAKRGRGALLLLTVALLARLIAIPLEYFEALTVAGFLNFLTVLFTAFGLTGLIAMLLFDIAARRVNLRLNPVLHGVLEAIAYIVTGFVVLKSSGVNLLSLLTTSAVLTAIIGFALQGTIANLFAGVSLQMDRTIGVDDWIQVGDYIGRVTKIKWRSTFMVTRDGDNVILPNATLLTTEVLNYSKPSRQHRQSVDIGLAYRHPPNLCKQILVDAVRGSPGILPTHPVDVLVREFGDSAITYSVRYWIDDIEQEHEIDSEVRTRIWYATQRASIDIPFPIRTVYMNQVSDEAATREQEREHGERLQVLKRIEIFSSLDDEERELLASGIRSVTFAVGEAIIRQGDPGDSLYVIKQGEVAIRVAVDGQTREVAKLKTGDFFGEMSLMTGEPRRATVAALGDVICYVVDHAAFQRIIETRPEIVEQVSQALARRQTELEAQRENLSAEARARRAAEANTKLLAKIRDFFNLG
jgi:small-conductance mechanosensitive channel/CRP-like cAMP-binding protein